MSKTENVETENVKTENIEYPEDTKFIVHKVRKVDAAGNVVDEIHGPMPIADWPAYAKKNGF